ncbi:CP12 domain-containing protein [Crocosphaera sp. Alani8]|uniref:CP12 domain-containing protein n=1 Tax=Crocosphaera sp. Alani8 TaxID=3038952 RepID=UPI00313C8D87
MKASEIMSKNVVTVSGSATVSEAVQLMKKEGLHSLIVSLRHGEDAYGIITETDVVYKVAAYGTDPKTVRVYEIMTKPCIVVNPDLRVEYVARLFAQTGISAAPVIKGELLGIITINHILSQGDFLEQPKSLLLEEELEKAREEAHKICQEKGMTSRDCGVAWDIVEEIQAELAHQRAEKPSKTHFEEYCEEFPDAREARVYDS